MYKRQADISMDIFLIGTRAGWGDSGGGLTFVQDDLYYVYGIASGTVRYGITM